MGLDDLYVVQEVLIRAHGRQVVRNGVLERRERRRRLIGEHGVTLKQGTTDRKTGIPCLG